MQPQQPPADPREGDEFFLNVAAKLDDPFPDLRYFREHRPVFHYAPLKAWFVFRYDDVAALFRDPRLSANRMRGLVDQAPAGVRDELRRVAPYLESFMLMKDGADHARVRGHLQPGLTPAVVQHLAGPIRRTADDLLDAAARGGRLDACADYAFLLPAYVLADLFGVPKADRGRVLQWLVAFIDFFNVVPITEANTRRMTQSAAELIAYAKELLAGRAGGARSEFLEVMAAAQAGGGLTADEAAGNVMLLLLAGHVPVRNLIGNALYLLLTHPDQFARLRAELALLPAAIEETLRYEPPVTLIPRIAAEPIELRGQTIAAGEVVQLNIASANRDAAHFPDGERFDIARPPGSHLAFGSGPHGCFGAALAREIAHVALEALLRRAPGLRLDDGRPITWYRNAANRGPINLPVAFDG